MRRFEIRYVGDGPEGPTDPVQVDAAMFAIVGEFTDFFDRSIHMTSGGSAPSGNVVFRVRNDLVADIRVVTRNDQSSAN